jgi:hypothetical protein
VLVLDEKKGQDLIVASTDSLLAKFVSVRTAPIKPGVCADFTR